MWQEAKNKGVQEKRLSEEARALVRQWGNSKGRVDCEVGRKKESYKVGTVFQEARGFKRQNWKTKHFNPNDNPLTNIESSEDEYADAEIREDLSPNPVKDTLEDQEEKEEE